ncbi:hypothetical protein V8C43DRAFT_284266, partial [Trichoderma afarasin]
MQALASLLLLPLWSSPKKPCRSPCRRGKNWQGDEDARTVTQSNGPTNDRHGDDIITGPFYSVRGMAESPGAANKPDMYEVQAQLRAKSHTTAVRGRLETSIRMCPTRSICSQRLICLFLQFL